MKGLRIRFPPRIHVSPGGRVSGAIQPGGEKPVSEINWQVHYDFAVVTGRTEPIPGWITGNCHGTPQILSGLTTIPLNNRSAEIMRGPTGGEDRLQDFFGYGRDDRFVFISKRGGLIFFVGIPITGSVLKMGTVMYKKRKSVRLGCDKPSPAGKPPEKKKNGHYPPLSSWRWGLDKRLRRWINGMS